MTNAGYAPLWFKTVDGNITREKEMGYINDCSMHIYCCTDDLRICIHRESDNGNNIRVIVAHDNHIVVTNADVYIDVNVTTRCFKSIIEEIVKNTSSGYWAIKKHNIEINDILGKLD